MKVMEKAAKDIFSNDNIFEDNSLSKELQAAQDEAFLDAINGVNAVTNDVYVTDSTNYTIDTTGGLIGGSSSSGYVTTTNPYGSGWTLGPPTIGTSGGNTITFSGISSYSPNSKNYEILQMPCDKMPEMVYVNGRLVTLGLMGSDVECAYLGDDKLIFSPGVLDATIYNERMTVSLFFAKEILHFNLQFVF